MPVLVGRDRQRHHRNSLFQELDSVDFGALSERLRQNSLQEKITAQWIRHCMPELRKQRTLV